MMAGPWWCTSRRLVGPFVLTNPAGAFRHYDAVQVTGRKRYSRRWQMQASYTWSRTAGPVGNESHTNVAFFDLSPGGVFTGAQKSISEANRRSRFDPTHEVKILGTYRMPLWGGVGVSGVYVYRTGSTWERWAFVGNPDGFFVFRAEPRGSRRIPATNNLDLRIEKTFPLHRGSGTLGVFADVFNVANHGAASSFAIFSGSNFCQPNGWVDPRILRLGVRFTF